VVLVREKSGRAYLDALRNGRMYCFTRSMTKRFSIREYSVVSGGVRAISGEAAPWEKDARLVCDIEMSGAPLPVDVVAVANGKVLASKHLTGSERIEIPLPAPSQQLGYVRVVMGDGNGAFAATNPIFLTGRERR
jgi:hypothetical protein